MVTDTNTMILVVPLLGLLAFTAIAITRMRDLWTTVMLTGIYSFLGASWMLLLDAPDVAFTEAAVGAGISTVLMLGTLALTSRNFRKRDGLQIVPLIVVTVTGLALVYGTLDMPRYGSADAPIHTYPDPSYVEKSQHDIHVDNVVTAVLASYRGYDTLGETVVIFTAGIGVTLLLRHSSDEQDNSVGASYADTMEPNERSRTRPSTDRPSTDDVDIENGSAPS